MESASALAAARSASEAQIRKPGRGLGAKMIGGLGAVVTVATVTAFMMSSSPQPSTAVVPQAATTLAAVSTPATVDVPAPLSTAVVTPPPAAAASPAATAPKDCKLLKRRFFVTGEGSVRLRVDGYVSPAISLSDSPQEVDLPMLRPSQGEIKQNIVVEGKAPYVILTTDYVDFQQGLAVDGRSDFDIWWAPLKNC